jgi:hypothetical protein
MTVLMMTTGMTTGSRVLVRDVQQRRMSTGVQWKVLAGGGGREVQRHQSVAL